MPVLDGPTKGPWLWDFLNPWSHTAPGRVAALSLEPLDGFCDEIMAAFVGELIFAIVRALFADWAHAAFIKLCIWADGKIAERALKIAVGVLLCLGAFFLIPMLLGILS